MVNQVFIQYLKDITKPPMTSDAEGDLSHAGLLWRLRRGMLNPGELDGFYEYLEKQSALENSDEIVWAMRRLFYITLYIYAAREKATSEDGTKMLNCISQIGRIIGMDNSVY